MQRLAVVEAPNQPVRRKARPASIGRRFCAWIIDSALVLAPAGFAWYFDGNAAAVTVAVRSQAH